MTANLIQLFTDLIETRIQNYRLGVYLAKNGAALDKYDRVEIVPEFMTGPFKRGITNKEYMRRFKSAYI